jgi:SpoVK/Ycf46/Vps4 family AAA+-type ATPase
MKVISTGSKFDIYPDDLQSFDRLPTDYYVVRFDKKSGFFLERYSEFRMTETRIYGVHMEKVQKVLDSFAAFQRNLGVILSGNKGIGKSLFARLLGREAVNRGIPVIIVEGFVDGIGSFIDRIDQEILVLFDEFDKTFAMHRDEGPDPQASMLSLFDGVAQGKKLFVVTCNELRGLNGFLVNRPGRFHYHFRFDYPTAEDIRNYLNDKLIESAKPEIESVIAFSRRIALNFDCLRAIAFELNLGQSFADAIGDLNIINVERENYQVTVRFTDGTVLGNREYEMDSFSEDEKTVQLYDRQGNYAGELSFPADAIQYNPVIGELYVGASDVALCYNDYYYDDEDENDRKAKVAFLAKNVQSVTIQRVQVGKLHYAV